MGRGYANTIDEITRIQRRPPPLVPEPFRTDTWVSQAWLNEPIYDHVGPMEHHIIAPTLRGDGTSAVRAGSMVIEVPSITGGVTVAPRGFSGSFECSGRPVASNLFLSAQRLQQCADEVGTAQAPELHARLNFNDAKLFMLLALLAIEAEHPGRNAPMYVEQLIDLVCLQLLREHSSLPLKGLDRRGLAQWQVRRITDFMQGKLDQPISVKEVADLIGLSRFHVCAAFHRSTGYTPHQWLVRLRIERAKELLRETTLTITEIGLEVGYQTPSAFAFAFRKSTGSSPTIYRSRYLPALFGWQPSI